MANCKWCGVGRVAKQGLCVECLPQSVELEEILKAELAKCLLVPDPPRHSWRFRDPDFTQSFAA